MTREPDDDPTSGDGVLVWNGALSRVRIRLPFTDASAPTTEGQAEATEPLRSRTAAPDPGNSESRAAGHGLAAVPPA